MSSPTGRKVRTTADASVAPDEALKLLKEGNARFIKGEPTATRTNDIMRKELVDMGQAPHTAIIGCADSRAPLETIFDALPGDIFVLRNAGNTCTHAEGSMVGSLEFCTGKLGARMILVLGHTKCGAVYGATNAYLAAKKSETGSVESALEGLLLDLAPVAEKAVADMGAHSDADEVAAHAVRVNVFHTIDFLLKYSAALREKVKNGHVEIQGGIYHLDSGKVEFMGRSPQQATLLSTNLGLPPSMTREGGRTSGYGPSARGEHGVRTTVDSAVPADEALKLLKAGNERFAVGAPLAKHATLKMREALVSHGQAPHTAILGCADSRVPVDTVFDAMPGDLFVLRNAGNTCTHAEGSMVGSLEFCCGKLGSKLILVMGHTKCGAIAGATATYLAGKEGKGSKSAGSALEGLLIGLSGVAQQAEEELGVGADQDQLVSHTVRVNVFSSIEFLLKYSPSLRDLVKSGNVEIQGGIYHLETGRVEFLGRSPRQAEILRSDPSLPPSLQALPIRTTTQGPLPSMEALKLLKEGNARFTSGAAISGKITPEMRKALVKEGQAPHTAIIGCADSRAPLETVFDAMPGDIFVLRNAGNTCTHAEGSIVGSLEFCIGALHSKMVLVLGHTACGAIKGATATYLQAKTGKKPQVTKALDALLVGLSEVAEKASDELGTGATEAQIVDKTIKLNVFHTIDFLLKYSPSIREKVAAGEVEIQGGIYDLETGHVEFLGRSPAQANGVSMIGGMAFDGPGPPGPPLREGGPPNGGAALLQQKMSRQRQLALEKQRSAARKQLGAGVIASASPMQTSAFRAKDWDQVLPDVLSLSPSAPRKEVRPNNSEHKTAPSSPTEEVERPEPVKPGNKLDLDDALDGLAEELLLDERLPQAAKRGSLEDSGGVPWPSSRSTDGRGKSGFGEGKAPRQSQSLAGIEEDHLYEASFELPASRAEGMRRKQQTLILEDGMEQAQAPGLTPNLGATRAPAAQSSTAPPSVGKSWDLTVEGAPPDSKTDPVRARGKADGRSWWPFGGGGGGREAASTAPIEVKEEVTAISSFSFD